MVQGKKYWSFCVPPSFRHFGEYSLTRTLSSICLPRYAALNRSTWKHRVSLSSPHASVERGHNETDSTKFAKNIRVVVIGGGAAGHMAAIVCSKRVKSNVQVCIIESSRTVLEKVRISGGGRCNVTSALDVHHDQSFVANYPRGRQEMLSVIASFNSMDTMTFFEHEGVPLKTEETGKVFPISNSSESIISALTNAADRNGVQVLTSTRVISVDRVDGGELPNENQLQEFRISLSNGKKLIANYVVIATGSARTAWKWASHMGHRIVGGVPSLFSFKVEHWDWSELAGLSVDDAHIQLLVDQKTKRRVAGLSQRGPILITHWGLSGPAVLSLSAFGARVMHERKYCIECVLDWIPALSWQEKRNVIEETRNVHGNKQVCVTYPMRRWIPRRLWRALVQETFHLASERCKELRWGDVSNKDIEKLVVQLHEWHIKTCGRGPFKEEFVTAGGVAVSDVNTQTFESKIVNGLYFAGETLDIDGRTGGYNLQFAWASGFVAGNSVANCIEARLAEKIPIT